MSKKTKKASRELTIVANIVFTCGLILGSIVVIIGVLSISTGQNSYFSGLLSLSGISAIMGGQHIANVTDEGIMLHGAFFDRK